jgi:tRNA(Ile)-lysidine synthase
MDALPIPKLGSLLLSGSKLEHPSRACDINPALRALQTFVSSPSGSFLTPSEQHPLMVAFSGGADSTAMLLAAKKYWPQAADLVAVHIHHGLQEHADAFECHARQFCANREVRYVGVRTRVHLEGGDSIEEKARQARYEALVKVAKEQKACAVLLAHHADDQVESMLLALTRGAGLSGLAGMPAQFLRQGVLFLRPLLEVAASALRDYLETEGVAYLCDPMNESPNLVRSRLRQTILPQLNTHFPSFRTTFARSAHHIWQAQTLLTELAQEDLLAVGTPPQIKALQKLSEARMANVLRYYFRSEGLRAPQTRQLNALMAQIRACKTRGHQIQLKVGECFVRRSGSYLVWSPLNGQNKDALLDSSKLGGIGDSGEQREVYDGAR